MSKTYFLLGALLILVSLGLVILPSSENEDKVPPEKLLTELMSQSRFLPPDMVAARLIDEDPSILLIDVRPVEEYSSYSLPGALNIPLADLLKNDWQPYLNQNSMDVVFFSNGDLQADQAWVLSTRLGFKNLYVMEGGLNLWFDQIMQPEKPPASAASEAFDLYSFRKGAAQYFGGGAPEQVSNKQSGENIPIIRREKKTVAAGGC
ncbi:MAG: rhodanese-like domain-containing protein [Bacteroidales bacterium]|nr:rhodanese-like domain-containing protein [Bacteroidales bacterium]